MEKANVIKALELCCSMNCSECPYKGRSQCDKQMCNDAASMLKANEAPKANRYSLAHIYTKKGNLLPYATCSVVHHKCATSADANHLKKAYEQEREIQLIAMFRWEGGKCYCKIKCPVNPLPVKGEFETPGTTMPVNQFLKANGWNFKETIYPKIFE